MTRKRFLFCLYCLLIWPAAAFVDGQLKFYSSYLFWWMASHSGATVLSRPEFTLRFWLLSSSLDGLMLGLVPIHRLRLWLAASFGRFRYPEPIAEPEWNAARPLLWAWVLPTIAFVWRYLTFGAHITHSVLGTITTHESSFAHFFGPPRMLSLDPEFLIWLNDRLILTTPMLFLLAYAGAVWLRHILPAPRMGKLSVPDEPADTLHT